MMYYSLIYETLGCLEEYITVYLIDVDDSFKKKLFFILFKFKHFNLIYALFIFTLNLLC